MAGEMVRARYGACLGSVLDMGGAQLILTPLM
jgi:hypothetical protein